MIEPNASSLSSSLSRALLSTCFATSAHLGEELLEGGGIGLNSETLLLVLLPGEFRNKVIEHLLALHLRYHVVVQSQITIVVP